MDLPEGKTDWQTGGQTNGQTDGQTEGQTDGQTNERWTNELLEYKKNWLTNVLREMVFVGTGFIHESSYSFESSTQR